MADKQALHKQKKEKNAFIVAQLFNQLNFVLVNNDLSNERKATLDDASSFHFMHGRWKIPYTTVETFGKQRNKMKAMNKSFDTISTLPFRV
jgi:hypothetical protein